MKVLAVGLRECLAVALVAAWMTPVAMVAESAMSSRGGGSSREGGSPRGGGSHERAPGYLGIEFHDTSDEQIAAMHLQAARGVEVVMVDHDGPAGKAGVQMHDILLQLDGKNIDGAEDLRKRIRESAPGQTIQLTLVRLGRAMSVSAKLADRAVLERDAWEQHLTVPEGAPEPELPNSVVIESYRSEPVAPVHGGMRGQSFLGSVLRSGPYTGAELDSIEPQLAQYFGAQPNTGLLVHGVDRNSPAAAAGLRAGDIVLRVDAVAVATMSEWMRRVKAAGGHAVILNVLREKHEITLTLQPDVKRHSLLEWPKIF